MKDQHGHELIQRQFSGRISEEELRELEEALTQDESLRQVYLDYASLDVALEASSSASRPLAEAGASGWWRPLFSVVVGLLIGALTSMLIGAFSGTGKKESDRVPLPLVDMGFEEANLKIETPIPRKIGVWSGDPSRQVTGGENGVSPSEGKAMLWVGAGPFGEREYCRVEQILDLRGKLPNEGGMIELTARVHPGRSGYPYRFGLKMRAFGEAGEATRDIKGNLASLAVGDASIGFDIPADQIGWQQRMLRMQVPEGANSLMIILAGFDRTPRQTHGGFYFDAVRVDLLKSESSGEG